MIHLGISRCAQHWLSVILIVCQTSNVNAQALLRSHAEGVSPENVGRIEVQLRDQTSGACWTNLREAREYAEERLASAGFEIVEDDNDYQFRIIVFAFRVDRLLGRDTCEGLIQLSLGTGLAFDGMFGAFLVAQHIQAISATSGWPDLNEPVLLALDQMIDEL